MRRHLHNSTKPCPAIKNDILLTTEIKEYILYNRIYHIPVVETERKRNPKKGITKTLRRSVWEKHVGRDIALTKCLCCETVDISIFDFECGHIIAESNGGETHVQNLIPVCNVCNNSMNTLNLHEFKRNNFPHTIKTNAYMNDMKDLLLQLITNDTKFVNKIKEILRTNTSHTVPSTNSRFHPRLHRRPVRFLTRRLNTTQKLGHANVNDTSVIL